MPRIDDDLMKRPTLTMGEIEALRTIRHKRRNLAKRIEAAPGRIEAMKTDLATLVAKENELLAAHPVQE